MPDAREGAGPVLAFAATFSCEPLHSWLDFWFEQLSLGPARFRFASYAQLQQEFAAPAAFAGAAVGVGLLRFSDWQRSHGYSEATFDNERFQGDLALFVKSLLVALKSLPRLVLLLCPTRPSSTAGPLRQVAFQAASERLQEIAQTEPRFTVVTTAELASWYPVHEAYDVVADEIGHLPYTESMWCALAAACARVLLPTLAPPLKAVIVDCDYTLWHNAVGEVGASGIVCGPRHLELQNRLIALRRCGIQLCICSRNIEDDVWAAFESEEMILHRDHITCARVAPDLCKAQSLLEIATELRLAPESFLFIDDNPTECLAVRQGCPEVPYWCVPQVHAEAKQQMQHVWRLDVRVAGTSAEDTLRAESYKAEAQRRALSVACLSRTDYYNELAVKISFQVISQRSRALQDRVIQLQERSNQFNAWKRLPSPPLVLASCEGFAMSVVDRYGDYGVVGAALGRRHGTSFQVLGLCMSCRVLGRGAEHAMLAELARLALRSSSPCHEVCIGVTKTERNEPIRRFLQATASRVQGSQIAQALTHDVELGDNTGQWECASPDYWYTFPATALSELAFDPEHVDEHSDEPEEGTGGGDSVSQAPQRLCKLADALSRLPVELRTVPQAMRLRGTEFSPPVDCSSCDSEAQARRFMRALWQSVLHLSTAEAADLQDGVPFASYGGNSVLAVQVISRAQRHGMQLPHTLDPELMTIDQLIRGSGFRGEPSIANACTHGQADEVKSSNSQSQLLAPTIPVILERDSRTPSAPLRGDVGGLSACAAGDLRAARNLVTTGWQPAYAVDKHRNTALMWAAGGGHLHVVQWLLEEQGVSADVTNKDGRTALMWACKNGRVVVARYLLEEGGADAMLRMKDDSTAFDWAVLGGDEPTMELLASHPGVDLHALNKFGCTSVQWAAASGSVGTCRWLFARGVDFSHVNQARHGAVNKAAWKGHREALEWLLLDPAGPRLTSQLLLLDHEGLSVAELARSGGHGDLADWLASLASETEQNASDSSPGATAARDKARCILR